MHRLAENKQTEQSMTLAKQQLPELNTRRLNMSEYDVLNYTCLKNRNPLMKWLKLKQLCVIYALLALNAVAKMFQYRFSSVTAIHRCPILVKPLFTQSSVLVFLLRYLLYTLNCPAYDLTNGWNTLQDKIFSLDL